MARHRRRRARRNPTVFENPKTSTWLLYGAGALAIGGIGYYLYRKAHPVLPPGGVPAQLPGPTKAAGSVTNLTLVPGTMAAVPLSAGSSAALSLFAPTGGTLGGVAVSPSQGVLASPSSGAPYEYVAAAAGSATITISWTNSAGASQTSTIPVTVTA